MDNYPQIFEESVSIGGRELMFSQGKLAELADGAVLVQYEDTVLLATAVMSDSPREGVDFFPLTVDYEERMYAAGKIPGGFIKREGRPSEHAILSARLTDRPLRPLFPKGFRNDVHIVSTVFSTDQQNDPDILSINGASAALTISKIPFYGPVGGVRMGYIDQQLVVNPSYEQLEESDLNIVVAGTSEAIMMVEGEANQVTEDVVVDAISQAHEEIKRIIEAQLRLAAQIGQEKVEPQLKTPDEGIESKVRSFVGGRLEDAMFQPDKESRSQALDSLKSELLERLVSESDSEEDDDAGMERAYAGAFDDLVKEGVRSAILDRGYRPDGRNPEEIRPIWCEVGWLPRTHGSAIFTRGQTQAVSVATLGGTRDDQMVDGLTPETSKRYIHHYNFPPYSVGEARFMRGPSRRDIGHGMLAERALVPVLPAKDDFPYTLRVVSDIVSSNGSTSMASVCGSSLALMDAGVPISAPVAGIAMGLVTDGEGGYTILSDIQGMEDFLGDMDFKVAGTRDGVTAIQMDIKVQGITTSIMRQALAQAHQGRLHILSKMSEAIMEARSEQSRYAPSITTVKIDPDQIGLVIGPGGKNIRAIQEDSGAAIDIEEDGTIFITAPDSESSALAVGAIRRLTWTPEIGEIVVGEVRTIIPVGAFVELTPGKDGFVHISQLGSTRVERVEDVVSVGDQVEVKVTEIRQDGKINLTMKGLANDVANKQGAAAPVELPEVGEIVSGTVKSIIPVGAFVEVIPGRDGFVHISQLGNRRYARVDDAVSRGDVVNVRITDIRPDGKIDLTMRGVDQDQQPGNGQGGFVDDRPEARSTRQPSD